MNLNGINFIEKFSLFEELWTPKCIAQLDNYIVKIAKIQGEFSWHTHSECDEMFIVHSGSMSIKFRDSTVGLGKGELFVVKKGVEHKPSADEVCEIIMFEREDVVNTGDEVNEHTIENPNWI